jgi:signal transduction histidine kinase
MSEKVDNIYLLVFLGMAVTLGLAFAIVLFYLRYQRRLMKQQNDLRQAELIHQGELLTAGVQSQEEERKRIGRDLHDGVGGALSNLRFIINRLSAQPVSNPLVQNTADECKQVIDDIISNVRTISHNLSPPGLELFGLAYTIDELCYQTAKATGIAVVLDDEAGDEVLKQLPYNTCLSIYRVIQELLNNTLKHAQAKHIDIILRLVEGFLVIRYADDGLGFDPATLKQKGMGLHNMESRLQMIKASFDWQTKPGEGFETTIKVKMADAPEAG